MRPVRYALSLITGLALMAAAPVHAKTLGTLSPPPSLTAARVIKTLPADQQKPWLDYLQRSAAQMAADKAALKAERAKLKVIPPPPPSDKHDKSMPLDKPTEWYAGAEARHIADVIVSFQTPAGGWGKNQDRTGAIRQPGQDYVADNDSRFLKPGDFDTPENPHWHYVGTLDNNATTTEILFLARVAKAVPDKDAAPYRAAIIRGVQYLLKAEFPGGGWPQVWPLEGGYHDGLTYNDDAMLLAIRVLKQVAHNAGHHYSFVPKDIRKAAAAAVPRGQAIILKTQVKDSHGVPTIWAQQYDPLTLAPEAARNFEPDFPAVSESVPVLMDLMNLKNPDAAEVRAVYAAVAWLNKTAIHDMKWAGPDHHLVKSTGAPLLWARYYTADGEARFGDRDKSIHDTVTDISKERRNGYAWYGTWAGKALKRFEKWSAKHPLDAK